MLLKNQASISALRGMPTDTMKVSKTVRDISSETVQLYYFNWSTLTIDAGQASWTLVVWKIANWPVLDLIWAQVWIKWNSSLSFTSTALTTEKEADPTSLEWQDYKDLKTKLTNIVGSLSNWDYVVDYINWVIYWKKASNTVTLTSTAYKISTINVTTVA